MKKVGFLWLMLTLWSCNRAEYQCSDCVVQYAASDPKQLTPLNATDPTALVIFQHLFQPLLGFDFQTNELVPILAKERPRIVQKRDGKVEASFEIRAAAKWDNGKPITGEDVVFSLKVIKCPQTDNLHLKPEFELIENVIVDKQNPKRFVVVYSEASMLLETALTDLLIIPKHNYDPDQILDKYSLYELTEQRERFREDEGLIAFADLYNSPKFQREAIDGSGAYRLAIWEENVRIILRQKENWWGKGIAPDNQWFQANPKELVFEIYKSQYAGYSALKRGEIHVMNDMPAYAFSKYFHAENAAYRSDFHILTAPTFAYDYIGINLKSPKLQDTLVRQALAHLTDVNRLIEEACWGFATPVMSCTHPALTDLANPDLKPYSFNIAAADSLLRAAGWLDLDSNGIRERRSIGAENDTTLLHLELTLYYNSGNDRRKKAATLLKAAAAEVGIRINIKALELPNLLDLLKKHDFELYIGGWVASPKLADPREIWHTAAIPNGSNYVSFGNANSDLLLEKLAKELHPRKRAALYRQLHAIIHREIPYIFLISQQQRIAVSKRFKNVKATGMPPGYWSPVFDL